MHYNTFVPLCMHANFHDYLCGGSGWGKEGFKTGNVKVEVVPWEQRQLHMSLFLSQESQTPVHITVTLKRKHPEAAILTLPSPSIDSLTYSASQSVFYFVT